MPGSIAEDADVVAGPVTGGALLAHTIAGLLDSRRALTQPARLFAPFAPDGGRRLTLKSFYRAQVAGKRVLLADDVRNTGRRSSAAPTWCAKAGGTVIATVEIYDRMESIVDLGVPNIALAEYRAPDNVPAAECRSAAQAGP